MKATKPIVFLFFSLLLLSLMGCVDEEKAKWDRCANPVAKDLTFRLGVWEQSPLRVPSCSKIKFVDMDNMEFLEDGEGREWQKNVFYRFDDCNTFKHNQYWIQPQPTNVDNNDYYFTSFNFLTMELYLIRHGHFLINPNSLDTLIFKKRI